MGVEIVGKQDGDLLTGGGYLCKGGGTDRKTNDQHAKQGEYALEFHNISSFPKYWMKIMLIIAISSFFFMCLPPFVPFVFHHKVKRV
jgi:hypothetical protein